MTAYTSSYDLTTPFSDLAVTIGLAANTELTYTVPGDASQGYIVEFSWAYDANVWVALNGTASVPSAGAITAGARSELRPTKRFVRGGDVIHIISSSIVSNAGMRLFKYPG